MWWLAVAKIVSFSRDKWIDNQNVEMIAPILLHFMDRGALAKRTLAQGPPSRQAWTGHFSARLPLATLGRTLEGFHLDAAASDYFQWMWINSSSFLDKSAYLAFLEGRTIWPFFV
jgi:hypothetical protein